MTQRKLEEIAPDECMELLAQVHVGRLVYQDDYGPAAVPVNFAMAGTDIVFRVEGGVKRHAMDQPVLAFEADLLDTEQRSAWSVLVRGTGSEVPMDDVPDLVRRLTDGLPRPWAVGVHNIWLRITPTKVTGRRLTDPDGGTVF